MSLWKSPPLVMQDWLVSVQWGLFLFISSVDNPRKTKSHYLLAVRCAFSSWSHSNRRWKESATAPMRWKTEATDDPMCHSFVLVSHFTWDSNQHLNVTINAAFTALRNTINKNLGFFGSHICFKWIFIYTITQMHVHTWVNLKYTGS